LFFFFFQAEDGIRDYKVTGVQTCALPILATLAGVRFHEVLRRDVDVVNGLCRTGEEFAWGPIAFAVHGSWRHLRIDDAIGARVLPADLARPPETRRDGAGQDCEPHESQCAHEIALPEPAFGIQPG